MAIPAATHLDRHAAHRWENGADFAPEFLYARLTAYQPAGANGQTAPAAQLCRFSRAVRAVGPRSKRRG
jgi:hypothetical protein